MTDLGFEEDLVGMKREWLRRLSGPWPVLCLVFVAACLFSPIRRGELVFLAPMNLTEIVRMVSVKGILAVGMTLVIITGGIDLSVGAILAFASTQVAVLLMQPQWPAIPAILATLMPGILFGVLAGVLITKGRIQPFVATLALMIAVRGAARLITGGPSQPIGYDASGADPAFAWIAYRFDLWLIPIPAQAVIFLIVVLVFHIILSKTSYGRNLYAIGGNQEAARLAGINITLTIIGTYALSGMLSALAGVIQCAQLVQGNPATDGMAYELDAIAAAVIGGTSLMGGVGRVIDTLAGALIIGIIINILNMNNVDSNIQYVMKGCIIVVAVFLQRWRR
ncbi:MAG: ABC transporter permease [bacterium]